MSPSVKIIILRSRPTDESREGKLLSSFSFFRSSFFPSVSDEDDDDDDDGSRGFFYSTLCAGDERPGFKHSLFSSNLSSPPTNNRHNEERRGEEFVLVLPS